MVPRYIELGNAKIRDAHKGSNKNGEASYREMYTMLHKVSHLRNCWCKYPLRCYLENRDYAGKMKRFNLCLLIMCERCVRCQLSVLVCIRKYLILMNINRYYRKYIWIYWSFLRFKFLENFFKFDEFEFESLRRKRFFHSIISHSIRDIEIMKYKRYCWYK